MPEEMPKSAMGYPLELLMAGKPTETFFDRSEE
jgi:hypothetical protein